MNIVRVISRYHFLVAFALAFLLIFIRASDRFERANIWAEDGLIYLEQAYELGSGSLFNLMAGYYQLFPRLIAYLCTQYIPIEWTPKFLVITSFLAYSLLISIFASNSYSWIIPSAKIRIVMVLVWCLVPGLSEILGNISNIASFSIFTLGIISLKYYRRAYNPIEFVLCILLIFTQGACILFLPAFAIRMFLLYRKNPRWRTIVFEMLIICSILIATFINARYGSKEDAPKTLLLASFMHIQFRLILTMFFTYPLLGGNTNETISFYFIPLILIVLFLKSKQPWNPGRILFVTTLLGFITFPFMTMLVRSGAAHHFSTTMSLPSFYFHRYSFLLPASGYLFWMTLLNRQKYIIKNKNFLMIVFSIAFVVSSVPPFFVSAYGPDLEWKKLLPVLKKSELTGCPKRITLSIYPDNWIFHYKSQTENPACPE